MNDLLENLQLCQKEETGQEVCIVFKVVPVKYGPNLKFCIWAMFRSTILECLGPEEVCKVACLCRPTWNKIT